MLTDVEIEFIKAHAYIWEHDWHLYAVLCGEPFLIESCLCFFDGEVLTVIAWSFDHSPFSLDRLRKICDANSLFRSASYIWYWGPQQLHGRDKFQEFACVDWITPSPLHADCVVDLNKFSDKERGDPLRKVRKAKLDGLTARRRFVSTLSVQHIRLIELYLATHKPALIDVALALGARTYVVYSHMILMEVLCGEVLCGWNLISQLSKQRHFGFLFFCDRSFAGASDLLYYESILNSAREGAQYLHLGTSAGVEGVFQFKKKWGAQATNAAPYHHIFYRQGLTPPDDTRFFLAWPERIVQRIIKS